MSFLRWVVWLSLLVPIFSFAEEGDSGNLLFSGSEVYVTYFLASQMKWDASKGGANLEVTFKGGLASKYYVPAFGYRWNYIRNDGFGFTLGSRVEIERGFSKIAAAGLEANNEWSFSFLLLEPNITHSIGKEAYWYLGMNYPVVVNKTGLDEGDDVGSGDPGFQIGMGWDLGHNISNIRAGSSRFNFEIYFQIINFEVSGSDGVGGKATLPGGGLRWGVNF